MCMQAAGLSGPWGCLRLHACEMCHDGILWQRRAWVARTPWMSELRSLELTGRFPVAEVANCAHSAAAVSHKCVHFWGSRCCAGVTGRRACLAATLVACCVFGSLSACCAAPTKLLFTPAPLLLPCAAVAVPPPVCSRNLPRNLRVTMPCMMSCVPGCHYLATWLHGAPIPAVSRAVAQQLGCDDHCQEWCQPAPALHSMACLERCVARSTSCGTRACSSMLHLLLLAASVHGWDPSSLLQKVGAGACARQPCRVIGSYCTLLLHEFAFMQVLHPKALISA
jgi:hypothetical protein